MAARKGAAAGSGARSAAPELRVREPAVRQAVSPRPAIQDKAGRAPRRALLDVNVLIALLDADHLQHARASAWLSANIAAGWASCAITQNGCVRIMSQPGYPHALPAARVAQRLREATETRHHLFAAGDPSLLDNDHFDTEQLLGHRQVTDAFLLRMAVAHGLRFVTFDANIPSRVVIRVRLSDVVRLQFSTLPRSHQSRRLLRAVAVSV